MPKKSSPDNNLPQSDTNTGFAKGSIGDISIRLGYDVRDLLISGYTMAEIHGVLNGEYTLSELFKQGPQKDTK